MTADPPTTVKAQEWEALCTPQFEVDIADYVAKPDRVEVWIKSILMNPRLGKAEYGHGGQFFVYDVEGLSITYGLVQEAETVLF